MVAVRPLMIHNNHININGDGIKFFDTIDELRIEQGWHHLKQVFNILIGPLSKRLSTKLSNGGELILFSDSNGSLTSFLIEDV